MSFEIRVAGILLACIGLGVYMLVRLVLWEDFCAEDEESD